MTVQHDADRVLGVTQESTLTDKYRHHAGYFNRGEGMTPRVNKNGGDLTTGEVLVDDVTTARGILQTTNAGDLRAVYVVPQLIGTDGTGSTLTIASNDEDWVYGAGAYVPEIDCDSAAVAIGDFLKTSATAKKATSTGVSSASGTPPPVGAFSVAMSAKAGGSNGTVACQMLGFTAGGIGGRAVATTAPANNQGLGWNASTSTWEPRSVGYVLSDGAETAVTNTTTETTIFTGSVPANTLSTNKILLGSLWFQWDSPSVGRAFTIRVKYGGTTLITFASGNQQSNVAPGYGRVEFMLRGDGTTSAQEALGQYHFSINAGAGVFGIADQGNAAIDSTAAQNLVITVEHGTTDADVTFTSKGCVIQGAF